MAGDGASGVAPLAVDPFIEGAGDAGKGMEHQAAADKAGAVGKFVHQQQAGGADAVGGEYHGFGLEVAVGAGGVDPGGAGSLALDVGGDFSHPGVSDQAGAGGEGCGPVGDVGRGFGAVRAGDLAGAAANAGATAGAVGASVQREFGGPPGPAEALKGTDEVALSGQQGGGGKEVLCLGGIGGVAGLAGDAVHAFVQGVVRGEVAVGDRPVITDAVLAVHAEVGWVHAGHQGGPHDGRAADGVDHQRGEGAVFVGDGVVGRACATVGVGAPVVQAAAFPVRLVGGAGFGVLPAALFEACNADALAGQAPGSGGTGGTGADDEHASHRERPVSWPSKMASRAERAAAASPARWVSMWPWRAAASASSGVA